MRKLFYLIITALLGCTSTNYTSNTREPSGTTPTESSITCSSLTRRTLLTPYQPKNKKKIKVAFFDADSTLRISKSGSLSANSPTDVRLLPNMIPRLQILHDEGYLIYIVSNQGGVQSKSVSCNTADQALAYTVQLIQEKGGIVHGYDFAESYNDNRKPKIGMATLLEKLLKTSYGNVAAIDKKNSIMVGDSAYKKDVDIRPASDGQTATPGTHFSNSDRLFAENYGIEFIEAAVFFGWRKFGIDVFENQQQVDEYTSKYK